MVLAADVPIITLREYERTQTDQLTPAQAAQLRALYGAYIDIERTFAGDGWLLSAKQYVGVIILDDVQIHIQPKVPLDNLFFMLTYAYDLARFRDETAALMVGTDLFEFIVRIFVKQVEQLVRRGLFRSYREFEADEPFLRGRLLLGGHLRRNAVHAGRFYQRDTAFTPDLLENRILAYTLFRLTHISWRDDQLQHLLRRLLTAFSGVSLTPIRPLDCTEVHYTRLNAAYEQPIHLARLLLQHLSLEGQTGENPFAAFMIDMNQLFERFVAYFLEDYFATDPNLDVSVQHTIWLDADHQERAEPDIVLQWQNLPVQVLDTKYKTFKGSPARADLYQMYVYSQTMRLPAGVLIYPDAAATGYRAPMEGVMVQCLGLDLSGDLDLFRARCQVFAAMLAERALVERH